MGKHTKHLNKRNLPWLLIAVGLVGLGLSALVAITKHTDTPKPPTGTRLPAGPSNKKPAAQAVATYNVAPDLPKYISVPAINIKQARIVGIGQKNGQISNPNNIYDAGWYTGSATPGQSGAMFIFGHVSNWQANGIFYNLKKLQPGDNVIITKGDNSTYTYRVVSSKVYPYDNVDMNQVLSPISPGTPGLNLMTCTGQVIKGSSEFNERLVVFTNLVQ